MGFAITTGFAQHNYDLKTVCLPKQLAWVEGLGPTPHPSHIESLL